MRARRAAQAGSDSLLTAATFLKLSQACFSGFEGVAAHRGVLYGLGSDGNNEARPPQHCTPCSQCSVVFQFHWAALQGVPAQE